MDAVDPGYEFRGQHIYADIYDLNFEEVSDTKLLQRALEDAIQACGAQICGSVTKAFEPHGFTCLYLLAESHASLHTYPERRAIFFDAFTCGTPDPRIMLKHFVKAFRRARVVFGHLDRGETNNIQTETHATPSHVEELRIVGETETA